MIKTWSEGKSLNFNKYLALHLVEMVFLYCGFLQVWKSIWHGLDLGSKDKTLFRKVQKGSLAIDWCAIVNRNWKCFITYVVLGRLSMHPADFGFILTRKSKLLRYCEIAGYCCHSIVWIWVWLKPRIPRKRENEKNKHKIGENHQNNFSTSGALKRDIMS